MDRNALTGWLGGLLGETPQSPAPLPMDPMDEALPPYLRQFYGSPDSAPVLPPQQLTRPQPGQTVEPRDPALMERAMTAARQAYESVLSGGSGLLGDIGDAASSASEAVHTKRREFNENLHTEWMNRSRKRAGEQAGDPDMLPPLPLREKDDPYYARTYPSLKRPQPGQDWEPGERDRGGDTPPRLTRPQPGQDWELGERPVEPAVPPEWANPYYTPQEPRRRIPLLGPKAMRRT